MTIQRRIHLITGFVLLVGLIIAGVHLWNSHEYDQAIQLNKTATQITRNAFLLRAGMDEYLAHGHKRALQQWTAVNDSLSRAIRELRSVEKGLLKDVLHKYEGVRSLESQLIQQGAPSDQWKDSRAIKETLAGMMSVRLEELIYAAEDLQSDARSSMLKRQQVGQAIIGGASISIIALIVLNLYLIKKTVIGPVQELAKGAEIIGKGDWDYTIPAKSTDELGKLATAFNTMAQNLKRSFVSLETEIRERKQIEQELMRSNQDLQKFAFVASHDLQEPLRNVTSCLQLLEKKYKNALGADADQYIHYAVESAARMKVLIIDLLEYSRIATRGKPAEEIDCEQLLDRALKSLKKTIEEVGAVITHDPLPVISGDDTQLSQVFQNLIQNAVKFRGDESPQIHVSAVRNGLEWIFSVKDNGIGIEPQHLDRIFVIFQRLHKRSQYDGTGMGLAIVKKVVERHGGRVWAESEPGVGTTFSFTIPDGRRET